jgi:hypothetical protein
VNVAAVDFLQVVRAGRLHFNCQARRAGVRELFSVNARDQAARAPGGQNPPRLRDGEGSLVAVNIAKLREARGRHRRNPSLDQKINVGVRAPAKFARHHVRPQKRRAQINGMFLMQLVQNFEDLQLVLPIEAVAALGFDGGGSVRREFAQIFQRASF